MYMCAAEKVAEEKFSGEPSARGEGSESLESLIEVREFRSSEEFRTQSHVSDSL